ncbi:MAG: hypothetical protein HFE45_03840 [Oscillospiraceae bacterium]|nr:hypothetical protein [Oscillospiraceae bacterium]
MPSSSQTTPAVHTAPVGSAAHAGHPGGIAPPLPEMEPPQGPAPDNGPPQGGMRPPMPPHGGFYPGDPACDDCGNGGDACCCKPRFCRWDKDSEARLVRCCDENGVCCFYPAGCRNPFWPEFTHPQWLHCNIYTPTP